MINKCFLSTWKLYIHYDKVKEKAKLNKTVDFLNHQTYLPMEDLKSEVELIENKEFVLKEDLENEDNKILQSDIDPQTVRFISKEMWDFFLKNYSGGPTIKVVFDVENPKGITSDILKSQILKV